MNTKMILSCAAVAAISQWTFAEDAVKSEVKVNESNYDAVVKESQEGLGRWYVSPSVGVMVLDGNSGNVPAFFNLSLGYDLTDYVSLEAGMLYSPHAIPKVGGGNDQLFGPSADVLFHLLGRESRFDPYLTLGAAYWYSGANIFGDEARNHTMVAPRIGLGMGYRLTDNWTIRAQAKTGMQIQESDLGGSFVETVELGALYRWGGGETEHKSDAIIPEAEDYNKKLEKDFNGIVKDATPEGAQDIMILELYINFDYDETVIKPEYYAGLNEISRVIKKAIAKNPNVTVSVEGHADRRHKSSAKYNQNLSERRAEVVKGYIANTGVDAAKLSAIGYGFSRPKVTPDLDKGNPENRRVDIFIRGVGDEASRNELRKN